jgi:hypothetical protein
MFITTLWILFKHPFSIVDSFQGPPHSLKDSNANSKMKKMEEEKVGYTFELVTLWG